MTAGKTSHLTKNLIHKMTNLAIDIQDLSVTFKDFKALQKLKLQVAKGSAMALLGQNGAGKTTTLRTLVNIYACLLYTSPSPRDRTRSRMPSSA